MFSDEDIPVLRFPCELPSLEQQKGRNEAASHEIVIGRGIGIRPGHLWHQLNDDLHDFPFFIVIVDYGPIKQNI